VFLSGSLPAVFAKTAAPIILVMLVNGSFTLVDAYFLGAFVGADALTAVTLTFPLFMLILAVSTLVSSGFSSVFARLLGGEKTDEAAAAFGQAISLSMIVCLALIALFALGGDGLTLWAARGSESLADMGYTIYFSLLLFVLAINSDALRCEGRVSLLAAISLTSVLLNVAFNYILIVEMGLGVAGSAFGTVLAQALSLGAIAVFRKYGSSALKIGIVRFATDKKYWAEILKLGAPSSLGYIGISLSAGAVLLNLQIWGVVNYDATVGAYGIVTRIMTFIFLPLLGMGIAFQTIVGNNFGAENWARTNSSVRIALWTAFIYCVALQLAAFVFRGSIGQVFVDDMGISTELSRILPLTTMGLFLFGPLMMIGTFFQAIGDAKRTAIIGLSRTYAFVLPLTFALPVLFGEPGIWYAGPVGEVLVLVLTFYILYLRASRHGYPWGLYFKTS